MSPEEEVEAMFAAIPSSGKAIGNSALRYTLGLTDERYWQVRQRLLDDGRIRLARGRGGSVYRAKNEDISVPTLPENPALGTLYSNEPTLYEPFAICLETAYLRDIEIRESYLVQITAQQGRRDTGGIWSRPDVVLIYVESFPYLPGRVLTIESFELKTSDALDVKSVYEAVAHGRFSNFPYLAFYLPDGIHDDDVFNRVETECDRFDIGLLWFKNPQLYSTFEFVRDPKRHQPDPIEQNDFIDIQVTEENKKRLMSWLK